MLHFEYYTSLVALARGAYFYIFYFRYTTVYLTFFSGISDVDFENFPLVLKCLLSFIYVTQNAIYMNTKLYLLALARGVYLGQ